MSMFSRQSNVWFNSSPPRYQSQTSWRTASFQHPGEELPDGNRFDWFCTCRTSVGRQRPQFFFVPYCSWFSLNPDAFVLAGGIMQDHFCFAVAWLFCKFQMNRWKTNETGRFFLGTSAVLLSSKGRQAELQVLQTCFLTASFRLVSGECPASIFSLHVLILFVCSIFLVHIECQAKVQDTVLCFVSAF